MTPSPFFFIGTTLNWGPQITHCDMVVLVVASLHTLLVMKVRKEPKEAIKVSEVTASHYIMCKSPVIFFISAVPYVSGCHFLN